MSYEERVVDAEFVDEAVGGFDERFYLASQWKLMFWKFRKHKGAVVASAMIILLYVMALFCEFLAPYRLDTRDSRYVFAPPQLIHFVDERGFHFRPFVYDLKLTVNRETLQRMYSEDRTNRYPIRLFVHGDRYKFWSLFETDLHLFGVGPEGRIFLFGTDRMGRDLLSRILYGARISLSIGLIGVFLSFVLGLVLGGISGYFGGLVDTLIQRLIEIIRSFPTIPLWLALSAALPADWPVLRIYFGITIILSLIGWTGLARVVRGKFLSLREEDFVTAARVSGSGETRIIFRHLLPSFLSHIVVSITLRIPQMILGETALSFLGLGLRPPVTSWGVLLQEAQSVHIVANHPWLLLPVFFVILAVLAFNFAGDGLRDAADPYTR